MRVSVVIPALNEQAGIAAAIASAWRAGADEVIVADGGSQDQTCAVAAPRVTRLIQGPPGRGLQLNAGAAAATGDCLLFLHADNRLARGTCQQIRDVLADDAPCQWGAFHQRIEASGRVFRWLERGNAYRVARWGWAYGDQAIFVRRAFFAEQGGFPAVPLMEDLIFSRAASRVVRPRLLPGPVFVSPRRWQAHGVVRQTLRNWALVWAFRLGVSPERLAAYYRRQSS